MMYTQDILNESSSTWVKVAKVNDIPQEGGACIKYKTEQIAVFNFSSRGEWYATQNMCPHKMQMILSRGMIGSFNDEPKVACPYHKKTFSLKSGECIDDDSCGTLKTYGIKIDGDDILLDVSSLA